MALEATHAANDTRKLALRPMCFARLRHARIGVWTPFVLNGPTTRDRASDLCRLRWQRGTTPQTSSVRVFGADNRSVATLLRERCGQVSSRFRDKSSSVGACSRGMTALSARSDRARDLQVIRVICKSSSPGRALVAASRAL